MDTYWLSLVGPNLEAEAKFRKAVSYESSPGHLALTVSGVSGLVVRNSGLTSYKADLYIVGGWL